MNDKQPKYYSIKELFGSDDYVIPIYQRNYEWGEPQITQLIQDIVDYIVKSKSHNSESKPRYYIGSLIAYERKLEGSVIYETIDGQQRLTTLTILLNVIKKSSQQLICLGIKNSIYLLIAVKLLQTHFRIFLTV